MNTELFAKFNNLFGDEGLAGLKDDIASAASNDGDFVDVPNGDYEVKVVKLEIGETGEKSKTPGMPMAKIWYEVLTGDFKGQKIFQNQMLTTGFGIHKMNELLNSFATNITVQFENFEQYADLFAQIFDEIDGKAEFQLCYGTNAKGYSTYDIIQRFAN